MKTTRDAGTCDCCGETQSLFDTTARGVLDRICSHCYEQPHEQHKFPCKKPKIKPIPFRLEDYSPNTNMIMGALLSGGDPLKLAEMMVKRQEKKEKKDS